MGSADFGEWQLIDTAPRDGTRILAVIRPTEQGAGEVDVVRWGQAHHSSESCWVAVDSDAECQFVYTDPELAFWMPMPSRFPTGRATLESTDLPELPAETGGSGI